ncbi:sulfate transporter [Nitzschia inconspicua]|uniref:Sulfate transporter n=1 Tax=Nitzschia inconspicua TaxID=303405 RepID=A0A9K3LM24_9STRA|nr:sulfate transporter [Nitzschia inconspicua]
METPLTPATAARRRMVWSSAFETALDEDPVLLRYRRQPVIVGDGDASPATQPTGNADDGDESSSKKITQYCQDTILHRVVRQYKVGVHDYSCLKLRGDFLAGCTVAVMAVPLSMSYAKLAGLPAYFGLYTSMVPPIINPLLSTSRQVAVGPAALVCLLLGTGLPALLEKEGLTMEENEEAYTARYTMLAIQSSLLVGMLFSVMGMCRLGFVTQLFLSRAVISGFTSGASVTIALSQLKYILGLTVKSSSRVQDLIKGLIQNATQFEWRTFLLGISGIIIIVICKQISTRYPRYSWVQALGPFLVALITISLTAGLDLESKGVQTVETIPKGLPSLTIDWWAPLAIGDLWLMVLSIAIVAYVQSFAISKRFAYKHGYEIDANQELLALGLTNVVGGMLNSFPCAGALGQSAVNDSIGAQSGVASMVSGVAVMMVLLFLTPVFDYMPLASLGAIVISYVISMFDYPEAIYLYKVHKSDLLVWLVAFCATIFLGVEYGLALAVGGSLLLVVYEASLPHTSMLGRVPGTSNFKNVKESPKTNDIASTIERYKGLVVVRINAPLLFFANAVPVRDKVRKYKNLATQELLTETSQERQVESPPTIVENEVEVTPTSTSVSVVQYIVLDLSPVTSMDTTALHIMQDMYQTQQSDGTQLVFANVKHSLLEKFRKSGLFHDPSEETEYDHPHFFSTTMDAVYWCLSEMDKEDKKQTVENPVETNNEQNGGVDHV